MKDTIQLHEIAGYLPYGLRMETSYGIKELKGIDTVGVAIGLRYWHKKQAKTAFMVDCKPILRPMSELTRLMLEEAGFQCHIDYLTYEFTAWVGLKGIEHVINMLPYGHAQWLYRNRFDIHNLIGRELAVDINSLKD